MFLSDLSVMQLIELDKIKVVPRPAPDAWQAMTLDAYLSERIYRIKNKGIGGTVGTVDMESYKPSEFSEENWEQVLPAPQGYYVLNPGEFFLAYTKEKLSLPKSSKISAVVEGKSGFARIGLQIHLAPIIHCGFGEKEPLAVMLEIVNHGNHIILLRTTKPICQFAFQRVDGEISSSGAKNFGILQPTPLKAG